MSKREDFKSDLEEVDVELFKLTNTYNAKFFQPPRHSMTVSEASSSISRARVFIRESMAKKNS